MNMLISKVMRSACSLDAVSGLLLFLALAVYVSEDFALKFAIPIVGGIQLLSIPLAKNIIALCNGCNLK